MALFRTNSVSIYKLDPRPVPVLYSIVWLLLPCVRQPNSEPPIDCCGGGLGALFYLDFLGVAFCTVDDGLR